MNFQAFRLYTNCCSSLISSQRGLRTVPLWMKKTY